MLAAGFLVERRRELVGHVLVAVDAHVDDATALEPASEPRSGVVALLVSLPP